MIVTFLALGSNLGDRRTYLKQAIEDLRRPQIRIVQCSSIFETEPKDVGHQPWFLNAVVEAVTSLEPRELLAVCLAVEQKHQRVRTAEKSARTLDVDILFYGDRVVDEPGLKIPHPRFAERNFALWPLAEIAPDFIDPVSGKTIRALLNESPDDAQVRRFEP